MKSIVNAKEFSEALSKVSKGLEKSALPILEEVCVVFRDDRCALISTNMEQWIAAELPACGDSFSFVFCNSKAVAKACACFDGELSLELTGEEETLQVNLSCGHRASEFRVTPGADYPAMPEFTAEETYTLNAARLLERVNRVKYAADKGSNRAEYRGVRFQDNRVACIDGYRMSVDSDKSFAVKRPFVIPQKAMEHVKLFGGGEITLSKNERHVLFSGNGLVVLSPWLFVTREQLDSYIPKTFRDEFTLSPREFLRELDFLNRSAPPKCKRYVRFDQGRLSLYTIETRHTAQVEISGSSTVVFGFVLSHMADAMKQFSDAQRVSLHISNYCSPIIVTAEDRGDLALVMPARLRETAAA